jgi:hypothetical protein
MPAWDPGIAVRARDAIGVTACVPSVPADISWLPESERAAAARDVNAELAGIVSAAPRRFDPGVLEMQRDVLITRRTAAGHLDAISHGNAFDLLPALARRITA